MTITSHLRFHFLCTQLSLHKSSSTKLVCFNILSEANTYHCPAGKQDLRQRAVCSCPFPFYDDQPAYATHYTQPGNGTIALTVHANRACM